MSILILHLRTTGHKRLRRSRNRVKIRVPTTNLRIVVTRASEGTRYDETLRIISAAVAIDTLPAGESALHCSSFVGKTSPRVKGHLVDHLHFSLSWSTLASMAIRGGELRRE